MTGNLCFVRVFNIVAIELNGDLTGSVVFSTFSVGRTFFLTIGTGINLSFFRFK